MSTRQTVDSMMFTINSAIVEAMAMPVLTDLSRNNLCHVQTSALQNHLAIAGQISRRELHQANGLWHYVVAHVAPEAEPTNDDLVTDPNPWQFGPSTPQTGHLHLPRGVLMERLQSAGAPDWFIALRGIQTIAQAHTMQSNPFRGSTDA
ncbi:MAG: hypothetical protein ABIV43_00365 [Candidatus Saccharimonadales bacterium]